MELACYYELVKKILSKQILALTECPDGTVVKVENVFLKLVGVFCVLVSFTGLGKKAIDSHELYDICNLNCS